LLTSSFYTRIEPFKEEAQTALFKDSVRTSQLTFLISVIKSSQLCYFGQKSLFVLR